MRNRSQLLGLCAVAGWAVPGHAEVLISNIAAPLAQSGTFFGANSSTSFKAAGFTIGSHAYTLDGVKLTIGYGVGGSAVVSIWSGATGPASLVQVLNAPTQSGSGNFTFTPASPVTLSASGTYWVYVQSIPNPTGSFMWEATNPAVLPTGSATAAGFVYNGAPSGTYNRIEVTGTQVGAACYANCDGSSVQPILTANDFQCFINRYVAGTSYANCDGSTVQPVLTANDFQCFINRYVAGCS